GGDVSRRGIGGRIEIPRHQLTADAPLHACLLLPKPAHTGSKGDSIIFSFSQTTPLCIYRTVQKDIQCVWFQWRRAIYIFSLKVER
ncbi:MAG TPA: hypothetical protein PLJ84_11660, partial [Bacteroidales bacterium]|nr:hypothetical protein [Bacteroidales bacterium]